MADHIKAHGYSDNHRVSLEKDRLCGCFYCIKIFSPTLIKEWILDENGTAMCPYCGIDSIIGESSGYLITEDFLSEMNKYWFGEN